VAPFSPPPINASHGPVFYLIADCVSERIVHLSHESQVELQSSAAMRTWTSILEQLHAFNGFVTRASKELRHLGDATFEWMQLLQDLESHESLGLSPIVQVFITSLSVGKVLHTSCASMNILHST